MATECFTKFRLTLRKESHWWGTWSSCIHVHEEVHQNNFIFLGMLDPLDVHNKWHAQEVKKWKKLVTTEVLTLLFANPRYISSFG